MDEPGGVSMTVRSCSNMTCMIGVKRKADEHRGSIGSSKR